jgi:hypothetical protein
MLSSESSTKDEVWNQLNTVQPMPHWSQFVLSDSDHHEILHAAQKLPAGRIYADRIKFPVTWIIEGLSDPIVQTDLISAFTLQLARQRLRADRNDLYELMTFNYVGQLKPDQTITTEIQRTDVIATIRFEIRVQDRKGYITYERLSTPNMKLRSEIHADLSALDPRIPPYEEYIDEDNRPYYNECLIPFRLREDIEVTDLSSNDPSVAGGDNGH